MVLYEQRSNEPLYIGCAGITFAFSYTETYKVTPPSHTDKNKQDSFAHYCNMIKYHRKTETEVVWTLTGN